MTALVWDQVGERTYATGVDRGVLYLDDLAVVWNGLTSVEEIFDKSVTPYFLDGVRYLNRITPGDYSAKLKAFTYPDEFEEYNGTKSDRPGVYVHDQRSKIFGLSYRTLIGNDVSATDRGYRIHVLYNLSAISDSSVYMSMSDVSKPIEFGWSLYGRPEVMVGYRPTAHISFDSTDLEEFQLNLLEEILYGTDLTEPFLPPPDALLYAMEGLITIVDNGDGTWTAMGPDTVIEMLDSTTFQIDEANAIYLDPDRYEISSTEV